MATEGLGGVGGVGFVRVPPFTVGPGFDSGPGFGTGATAPGFGIVAGGGGGGGDSTYFNAKSETMSRLSETFAFN